MKERVFNEGFMEEVHSDRAGQENSDRSYHRNNFCNNKTEFGNINSRKCA